MQTLPHGYVQNMRLSAVDLVLETLADLERRNLAGRDVDGFLGLGIATLAGGTLFGLKSAETDEDNLLATDEGFFDGRDDGIESRFAEIGRAHV